MPDKKIKVLYVIPTLDFGGAERIMVDLARLLDRKKFTVKIVCMKRAGELASGLDATAVELVVMERGMTPAAFWKLYKLISASKPDIVHTHLFGADVFGIIAARLAGVKKVVSTEHNINYSEGRKKSMIKNWAYSLADRIVAVSEAVKKYLLKAGNKKNKIEVIYNGTDPDRFKPSSRGDLKDEIIIGSIGRLEKQKSYGTLIMAMDNLKNIPIECRLAGNGREKEYLSDLVTSLGLADKVKFTGWNKDIPSFLAGLDIFVLPSAWEGFGITLIEAGAQGLPVIGSRVDGITEIIEEGVDGLMFKPGDSRELAYKLELLASDKILREKLGANLRRKVMEKFTLTIMVKKYEDLYVRLYNEKENYEDTFN
jgi:glycosyltransferase involved in cell wall biosynthesis